MRQKTLGDRLHEVTTGVVVSSQEEGGDSSHEVEARVDHLVVRDANLWALRKP